MPIGSLLGGALGGVIGLRATLLVSALGSIAACLWVYFSPVRQQREQRQIPPEQIIMPGPGRLESKQIPVSSQCDRHRLPRASLRCKRTRGMYPFRGRAPRAALRSGRVRAP